MNTEYGAVAFLKFGVSGNIPQSDFQDNITPQRFNQNNIFSVMSGRN